METTDKAKKALSVWEALQRDTFPGTLTLVLRKYAREAAKKGANPYDIARLYNDLARNFFCKRLPTAECDPCMERASLTSPGRPWTILINGVFCGVGSRDR